VLALLATSANAFVQTEYGRGHCRSLHQGHGRFGKESVQVMFSGYAGTSQITCLQPMAKKIAVAQSTSGDVPE